MSKSSSMLPFVVGDGLKLVVAPAVDPSTGLGLQGEACAWLDTGAPQGSLCISGMILFYFDQPSINISYFNQDLEFQSRLPVDFNLFNRID